MRFLQFFDWMTDAEQGIYCNRQGALRVWDRKAIASDQVEPMDPATVAVLDDVLTPDRLAVLQTFEPPPILTFLEFMALFTPAEQSAIVNSTDTVVKLFTLQAAGTADISLSDPRMQAALGYLVSANVITAPRVAAVLANQAPAS